MVVREEMESFKMVSENGTVEYVNRNGKYHREDGPAVECVDGTKHWFLNGKELTEVDFLKWQLKNSKTVKLNFQ